MLRARTEPAAWHRALVGDRRERARHFRIHYVHKRLHKSYLFYLCAIGEFRFTRVIPIDRSKLQGTLTEPAVIPSEPQRSMCDLLPGIRIRSRRAERITKFCLAGYMHVACALAVSRHSHDAASQFINI